MSDISTKAGARRPRTLAECRAELAHKRDTLIANIKAAEAGPRGGGRSRGVQLDTPQKSTAWLSWGNGTYVDADYPLPRLRWLYLELRIQHDLDLPSWQGDPRTDAAALQMLDDYLAACDRAIGHAPPNAGRGEQQNGQQETELPWGGPEWDDLAPQTRRLLRHMYGRESDEVANFTDKVWEKDDVSTNSLHTAISRANNFLRKQNHPRLLSKVRGELTVRWV